MRLCIPIRTTISDSQPTAQSKGFTALDFASSNDEFTTLYPLEVEDIWMNPSSPPSSGQQQQQQQQVCAHLVLDEEVKVQRFFPILRKPDHWQQQEGESLSPTNFR